LEKSRSSAIGAFPPSLLRTPPEIRSIRFTPRPVAEGAASIVARRVQGA
jgi:hypothetical protein